MNVTTDNLNRTNGIRLPHDFQVIDEKLSALKAAVKDIQATLPKPPLSTPPELEAVRRDALKASLELKNLEDQYSDTLGLLLVDARMHEKLRDVGETRKIVAEQYLTAEALMEILRPLLKSASGKVSEDKIAELKHLEDEIKQAIRSIHAEIHSLPELGMTFEEWDSLRPVERKALRSPGRPTAPLEAQIIKTKRHLYDCVALANRLSGGKIRTIEDALDGVQLTRRGRPQVSELGKMDRRLANLVKRLEEVASTHSKTQAMKKSRLMAQISELREAIAEQEANLNDAEMAKRELEKLRASHRDMVVSEVTATGDDQASLLMAIIRNEDAQLTVVNKILALDPEARVTVTHKVNPKETRKRFERLRMKGVLNKSELEELDRHERRQDSFSYSRNR